jgi:ornithine carbamoyltransferase
MPPLNFSSITRSFARCYSTASPAPRHLLTIADLTPSELTTLVQNAASHKSAIKAGTQSESIRSALRGQTIGISLSKLSTRTRVSSEAAVAAMGGHPMFLGKGDIQLGVNESLRDTSLVISSMVSGIIARVGPHSDVEELARHSSVPVINGLSDKSHPLQAVATFLTMSEAFGKGGKNLGIQGLKMAWVGDANNVFVDLAIGAAKLGVDIAVATPEEYRISDDMRAAIKMAADSAPHAGKLTETTVPEEAVKGADILVTDTWVSMGQEEETAKRLKAFAGFQITNAMAKKGGAKEGWKFMHCLPRHPEEVSDEVFYGPRSLAFQEAGNRLWAAISVMEVFVVKKGKFD